MLNGVYSQNIIRQSIAQQMNSGQISTPQHNYPQFKEFSPEANKAICAYMSPVINRDTVPQIPLKAMINRLKMQGKIEGKDFTINEEQLIIKNKYGRPDKIINYLNGDYDHWSTCDQFTYIGNNFDCPVHLSSKNGHGQTLCYAKIYPSNKTSPKKFMPEEIAESNSLGEYIEYLENNNLNYIVKKNGNDYFVTRYDDKNKRKNFSQWNNNRIVHLNKYDEYENATQEISFRENETVVTNYTRKRIPVGHFSRKEFPQENFTDEKITYETTPRDYVNYLKKNGVKYKATKVDNHDEKCIVVKEFDKDNKEKAWTIWSYELNSDTLIGIQHEVYKPNGKTTRVVIEDDKTFVEKIE